MYDNVMVFLIIFTDGSFKTSTIAQVKENGEVLKMDNDIIDMCYVKSVNLISLGALYAKVAELVANIPTRELLGEHDESNYMDWSVTDKQ